jgi:hypothetical protein
MPSTGTAPGVSKTPATVKPDQGNFEPKPEVPARARQGAHYFFWITALVSLNVVFTILGSHIHRFTGLGVTAMMDRFALPSGMQLMVSLWLGAGFLYFGYFAAEGRKRAFVLGMLVYAADAALLAAVGDYLGAIFHGCMLYAIYRGFSALGQPSRSEPSDTASGVHAG